MKTAKNWKARIVALALVLATMITVLPATKASADELTFYGGYEIAWKDFPVYSTSSWTYQIGTIYKFEGFTVLLQNAPYGYLWVEYSTPNGTKRGYIQIPQDEWGGRTDGLGKVITTSNVYYGRMDETGTYGTYQQTGTVFAGEYVAIIAKNDNWVYIEYNSTAGRKRGYMEYTSLEICNRPGYFNDMFTFENSGVQSYVSGRQYVYAGPTNMYAQVGWVENEYVTRFYPVVRFYDETNHGFEGCYIEYQSGGQTKSGFLVTPV